jgi:ABC-type uncharacterized transport system ATPase subunit
MLRGLAGAGKAVLLIEHDPVFVRAVADEVHELASGSLHPVDTPAARGKAP